MVSGFTEKKGIPILVKSFSEVKKQVPQAELCLIGDGPQRFKVLSLIAELGLTESVLLKGFMPHDQIQKELHYNHIFVHPSVTTRMNDKEGIPTAIMEAQATGMPVISTYHAGMPELVIDGKTGFLVEERNVSQLANKMIYLALHPELWIKFGIAGRKRVEQEFNITVQIKQLEGIYDQLIGITSTSKKHPQG